MASPQLSQELIFSKGLNTLTGVQITKTIYVANISANATIKEVSDFFSFCGNVEKLIQDRDPSSPAGKQFAVVVFEEEGSYSTSLLLGNAIIVDSPIAIYPYAQCVPRGMVTAAATGDKNATTIVASLLASGYVKGEQAIAEMKAKATEFDGKVNISTKAKAALGTLKETTGKLDTDLKISENFGKLKDVTMVGAKSIDDKLHIKDNLTMVGGATMVGIRSMAQKSKELSQSLEAKLEANPTLKTMQDGVKAGWGSLIGAFSTFKTEVKDETAKRRGDAPSTSADGALPTDGSEYHQQVNSPPSDLLVDESTHSQQQ